MAECDDRQRRFLAEYVQCQQSVWQLLRLLIQDHHLREDTCQAVALRLWEVFDEYDPSRPFNSWARGVAAKVVLEMQRSDRRAVPAVTSEWVASVVEGFERSPLASNPSSEQFVALEACLGALPPLSRELIAKRYHEALPVDEVARQMSRTLEATYKALARSLRLLGDCVRQRLSSAGEVHVS